MCFLVIIIETSRHASLNKNTVIFIFYTSGAEVLKIEARVKNCEVAVITLT